MCWSLGEKKNLSSRPIQWPRPELVPPASYLVCHSAKTPGGSGVLVMLSLIDVHFR